MKNVIGFDSIGTTIKLPDYYDILLKKYTNTLKGFGKNEKDTKNSEKLLEFEIGQGSIIPEDLNHAREVMGKIQENYGEGRIVTYSTCNHPAIDLMLQNTGQGAFIPESNRISTIDDFEVYDGDKSVHSAERLAARIARQGIILSGYVDDKINMVKQTVQGVNNHYGNDFCQGFFIDSKSGVNKPEEHSKGIYIISDLRQLPLEQLMNK